MNDDAPVKRYSRPWLQARCRRDLHVHTAFCNHAEGSMAEYVTAGLAAGLDEIGFLAHVEKDIHNRRRSWLEPEQLDLYWAEGRRLQRQFDGRILITLGIELGLNPRAVDGLRQLVARHPWDRLGLSYHYLEEPPAHPARHRNICSARDTAAPGLTNAELVQLHLTYFDELRRHVPVFRPAFVCHLDVIRRYLPDVGERDDIRAAVHDLLATMARHGTALEINTSGYDHGGICPAPWIIQVAARFNLDFVFCSDSHHPRQVGRFFNQAVEDVLRAIGSKD
ncbi:MAG: histidinol-phosphatase [Acidobacteria bacterium]|nr:histidinol-phosphatase [Acidobacteriota bacterium]